jgi:hypothetical protein
MKIIKEGESFSWSKIITCSTKTVDTPYCLKYKVDPCGAELEYDRDDIQVEKISLTDCDCRPNGYEYKYYIICPTCKSKINIPAKEIPPYIQAYIQDKFKKQLQ